MPPSQFVRPRNPDDSRSDASSIATKDRLSTMATSAVPKTRKGAVAQPYAMENISSIPSSHRNAQNAQNAASSAAMEPADPELPHIPWHDMDLKDLHNYRHAHRLTTSSSQNNPQAHLIFANAAHKGLYSPSVVAARRKQRELRKSRKGMAAGLKERSSSRLKVTGNAAGTSNLTINFDESGRQTKEQLAIAVRKHFNAMSVHEGEVVARFTYVVRQIAGSSDGDLDKGFRMRFKP